MVLHALVGCECTRAISISSEYRTCLGCRTMIDKTDVLNCLSSRINVRSEGEGELNCLRSDCSRSDCTTCCCNVSNFTVKRSVGCSWSCTGTEHSKGDLLRSCDCTKRCRKVVLESKVHNRIFSPAGVPSYTTILIINLEAVEATDANLIAMCSIAFLNSCHI